MGVPASGPSPWAILVSGIRPRAGQPKREKNLNATEAVRYAFSNVGVALLVTTFVLAAGFLVLSMSAFELNSAMGLLTAITIVIALIIDFLFLPPLLIALEERQNENKDKKEVLTDLATSS